MGPIFVESASMNCNAVTGLATTMNYPMGDLAVSGLFPMVVCFKTPNTGEMARMPAPAPNA
jgi:hypothetical protein